MSKSRYTAEQRTLAVEEYLNGYKSASDIRKELEIASSSTFRECITFYQEHGTSAFSTIKGNKAYPSELKNQDVKEYLEGTASSLQIIAKYNISSRSVLRSWIKKYNSDMELKDYNSKQEVYMAEARRKTTIDERKDIVKYCIAHKRDYKDTAEKYNISYNQVYSWVRKYDSIGEEGLTDKRGHHKSGEEIDELEKLRRENKRLKHQLEERDMAVELLKKVKEFERRRF